MGKLDSRHNRVLQDLIISEWDMISKVKPTRQRFADTATRVLGVPVSVGNLTGACRAIDKAWPAGARNPGQRHSTRKQVIEGQRVLAKVLLTIIHNGRVSEESKDKLIAMAAENQLEQGGEG